MQKILLSCFLAAALFFCFSQDGPVPDAAAVLHAYRNADRIFQLGERFAVMSESDEEMVALADKEYLKASALFAQLLPLAQKIKNDSLLFFIQLKKGLIYQWFDSLGPAKNSYLGALALRHNIHLADSFYFKPTVLTGSILYRQDKFDSAILFLKNAELIKDKYINPPDGAERLYNLLGVIHYETGNYRQAVNYFEKALSLLAEMNPAEMSLKANYKINIASTLMKTDENNAAKKIYEELLPYNVYNNEIYHKLGLISLKEENYPKAISYLQKVKYENSRKTIDLYLNYAMGFAGLKQPDSAEQYLHKALAENLKWNGHRKNISYGLLLKFQGDELAAKEQYREALPFYQGAIMQFDNNYNEPDINRNPEKFSGVLSFISLFSTLTAKADALEKSFTHDNRRETLDAALNAYRSAFSLADYVEKTYNSDEARLFLGKIKHEAHSRPIDIGLRLFKLTREKKYLEEVFMFDQRNKASVLSFNVKMREISADKLSNGLYRREAEVKSAITRLSLRAANITDSAEAAAINAAIRDNEIELEKIREEINAGPLRQQLLSAETIPPVTQLQRKLDNVTALLSFHLSKEELLTLVITSNRFEYYQSPINRKFFGEIESLKASLYQASPEERYSGSQAAVSLYNQLISPALPSLTHAKRIIIIPDDELHYLPFEVLEDGNSNYLFQKFAIQYQYSAALLGNNSGKKFTSAITSFAPFSRSGYRDSSFSLSSLPASAEEIKVLSGETLLDSAATKTNFLSSANHFNIIHLATHALADNNDPDRSFISFYPGNKESRLYAGEIYDMRLDTTSLIILSACETGTGKLVKGEGLMSLSRAFAYAGCPNIITSLWKAEDNITAFITQRLHYYLGRNETRDKALQLAKIDFLKNPNFDSRLKLPNYWAHLVLIGEYEPDHKRSNWPFVAVGIVLILLAYYYFKKRSLPAPAERQA